MNTTYTSKYTRLRTRRAFVLIAALLCAGSCSISHAAIYNVNTTSDGSSSSGTVNLRGAILAANSAGGSHTINVPSGTYNLTLGEITFGTTAQNITIAGTAPCTINMTTTNQDRIFNINPNIISNVVTSISNITFTNGYLSSDQYGGGAIVGGGPSNGLTLTGCTFSNNSVSPGVSGGPISGGGALCFGYGGTLTISGCSFTGNPIAFPGTAAQDARGGGAIYLYNYGSGSLYPSMSVSITGSTFSSNSVSNSGRGGAIFMKFQPNGTASSPTITVDIQRNSFTGNSAPGSSGGGYGGAIYVENALTGANPYTISYNRFAGNTSGNAGSALYMEDNVGNVNASNNWWGCNSGPASCADRATRSAGATQSGALTSTPHLQLKTSASPASICANSATTITTGFTSNSAGSTVTAANLSALTGLPVSFSATQGTISGAATTIQSTGTAQATYTAGSTSGTGTVNTLVDNVPTGDLTARASITVSPATGIGTQPAASTGYCAGNTVTLSIGTTGGGTPTYQWRRGTTPLNDGPTGTGSTISGATTATLTITNAQAGDAATNYNVVVSGCGSVTSANAALNISPPGTWLGTVSADWSNTANWSCATLPTVSTDVTIPSGTTFSPQINITTATAASISISAGASLSFAGSSNVLTIPGAISGAGSFNPAGGKVIFSGSTQSIPAGNYKDLEITGAASTKSMAGAVSISGVLTFSGGYLLPGNNDLTIAGAGFISGASAGSFVYLNGTGDLVQQNIGAGGRAGAVLFPVGIATNQYSPVAITNAGTADVFRVSLLPAVYAAYDAAGNPVSAALTTNVVSKTWLVSEGTAGGSNASLTFQWAAADELSGFTRSNCFASHYYSGSWHRGAASAAGGTNPYIQSITGVTTFSPFGVGSGATPLPVELQRFQGYTSGTVNHLSWTFGKSEAGTGAELQRSEDGQSFQTIYKMPDAVTAGTAYTFDDATAPAQSYYRLAMRQAGGTSAFSTIIVLRQAQAAANITVSPNPFSENLAVDISGFPAGAWDLELADAFGRIVASRQAVVVSGAVSIAMTELADLRPGVYFLSIESGQERRRFKLVKS